MKTVRLNTSYDLEYYKKKCDEYMTHAIEVMEKYNELQKRIIEQNDLLLIIDKLEREKKEHRAYTVKLKLSTN